jgi:hypothetical protein
MNYKITTPTQIIFVRKDISGTFIVELDEIDIYMRADLQTKIMKKKNIEVNLENLVAGRIDEVKVPDANKPEISTEDTSTLKVNIVESAKTGDKFGK